MNVKEETSRTATTVKGLMTAVNMGKGQLTDDMVSSRTMGGGNTGAASPQRIIAALVGGGVCERFPDLHFNLVEFSAGWLVSYLGFIIWGNDYPHAEGTFRSSAECIAENFDGVPDEDRAAILGGTLADLVGFDKTRKLATQVAETV